MTASSIFRCPRSLNEEYQTAAITLRSGALMRFSEQVPKAFVKIIPGVRDLSNCACVSLEFDLNFCVCGILHEPRGSFAGHFLALSLHPTAYASSTGPCCARPAASAPATAPVAVPADRASPGSP